jgi:hypothetical protein
MKFAHFIFSNKTFRKNIRDFIFGYPDVGELERCRPSTGASETMR